MRRYGMRQMRQSRRCRILSTLCESEQGPPLQNMDLYCAYRELQGTRGLE